MFHTEEIILADKVSVHYKSNEETGMEGLIHFREYQYHGKICALIEHGERELNYVDILLL